MRFALVAAALLLALAGCSSPAAKPPPAPVAEADADAGPAGEPDGAEVPVTSSGGQAVDPVQPMRQRTVLMARGTTVANAAGWGPDTALALGIRALDLYVPAEAGAVVVELAWAAPQDLDLEVHAPPRAFAALPEDPTGWARCYAGLPSPGVWCDGGGHAGAPDGPVVFRLSQADLARHRSERCEGDDWGDCNVYAIGLRSKDANAGLDWTVAATVFVGEDPPAGYHVL